MIKSAAENALEFLIGKNEHTRMSLLQERAYILQEQVYYKNKDNARTNILQDQEYYKTSILQEQACYKNEHIYKNKCITRRNIL